MGYAGFDRSMSMEYLDIIVFAAVAVVLLVRLWGTLGRRNGDEPERPNPFIAPPTASHDEEDVMVLPDRARAQPSPLITAEGHAADSLAGAIDRIKALDPAFDEKKFLEGAKIAFARIVEAFAKGDLTGAGKILAPSVREGFQKAVDARRAARETLESRIGKMVSADVVAAQVEETKASLTVEFVSNQINVTRGASGAVVSGSPQQAEEIRDVWVFARDMKSPDPNWQLVETRS